MVENLVPGPWPNRFELGNSFNRVYQQYAQNMTTNLTTWYYSRINNFLKMKCYQLNNDNVLAAPFDHIDIRNTMKALVYNQDWAENDPIRTQKMAVLFRAVQQRCLPSFDNYRTIVDYIQCRWFESLRFFIFIQREIGEFLSENYKLVQLWLEFNKHPEKYPMPTKPMPPKIKTSPSYRCADSN